MAFGKKTGGRCAGTPNKATAEIREAAQVFGPAAIERLAQLAGLSADDAGNPVPGAESEAIQVPYAATSVIQPQSH
jgi:hypothetical protein